MTRSLAWLLGCASALVMVVAFGVPSGASGPSLDKAPPPAAPEEVDGKTVFLDTCKKCHGPDGKGDTGMGRRAKAKGLNWPDLTVSEIPADEVETIIIEGVKDTKMKAYKEKLSPEQITAVRDYVLSLRGE